MPSRKELDLRARVVGIDPAGYPNDSKLEQRIIWNEYNWATVTGTLATTTLTSSGTANSDGDTITLGSTVYTYKTALTEVVATNTLTSSNVQVTDGDTVTINAITYTFRATIAKPNDVHLVTNADTSLTNLVSAITAAGTIGTDYGNGTVAHPDVTAGAVNTHATVITALKPGVFGNNFSIVALAATLSVTGFNFTLGVDPIVNQILIGSTSDGSAGLTNTKATLIGTTNAGVTFSTGTVKHPLVTPTTINGTTLVVNANKAASGFTIATTGSTGGGYLSWTAATMGSNVQAIIAKPTEATNGVTGGALV